MTCKFHVKIAHYATLEKQHNGTMKEKNSINDASETKMITMLYLDISEQQGMRLLGIKLNLLHLRKDAMQED